MTVTKPSTAEHVAVNNPRYQEIDVLRGLAALWVILSHYLPFWQRYFGDTIIIVPNLWGQYAVWLFFVISGFVILSTFDRAHSVGHFAVLRFSRLYPAYWATLLLSVLIGALVVGRKIWLNGLIVNFSMFQEFLAYPNLDNVYWSLTVELAFYLNAAWLLALGLHRRPQRIATLWLSIACIWALTIHQVSIEHDNRHVIELLFILDYCPFFVIGMMFHDATKHGWSVSRIGLIAFALIVEYLMAGWWGLRAALCIVPIFALALNGQLKFLVSKVTLWLGAISYSLYLIHRNFGYDAMRWLHEHQIVPAIAIPLSILAALMLASVVTFGIEQPAMRAIRLRYAGWQRARQSVAA